MRKRVDSPHPLPPRVNILFLLLGEGIKLIAQPKQDGLRLAEGDEVPILQMGEMEAERNYVTCSRSHQNSVAEEGHIEIMGQILT